MTDSGASSGSTAKFGDSDSLERAVALPTVEELGSLEDAPIPATSDEELGSAVYVPSVVSGILSIGLLSSDSSTTTAKVPSGTSMSRSPSARGGRRAGIRGRTPPPAIKDAGQSLRVTRPSASLRTTSSPTAATALSTRAQEARSQQIEQRRTLNDEVVPAGEKGRAMSAQAPVRSVAQDVAATILGAEFQRMKEELEHTRSEASRVTRENERIQEKLIREKSVSAAKAAECAQAVTFAKEISEYAAGATQKIDELCRTSAVQVSQAKHLFDHVKLAERHIDEVDSEKQQYAAEVQRLRQMILSLEKRARDTNEHVERLKHEAKMHESEKRDLDAARFGMHDLETKITLLSNENRLLTQKVGLQGLGDATLSKRLAEKSKEFDDLAAELRETKASQRGVESRIHGEVSEMQQEMLRLRIHAEQTQSEVIRLNMVVHECDSVIAKQRQLISDL